MKRFTILAVIFAGSLIASISLGLPQQGSPTPSLGDLAKKMRAERAKEGEKPAKVYTNDNIPRTGALSEISPSAKSAQSAASGSKAIIGDAGKDANEKAAAGAHDEKYYREAMKELQSQKEMHQRELAVLDQKLSLNSTQYYSDPNKTMNQEFSRSDINKKQDEIEKKKQQIVDDDKAIGDLEAQCQREGCPPGWLR